MRDVHHKYITVCTRLPSTNSFPVSFSFNQELQVNSLKVIREIGRWLRIIKILLYPPPPPKIDKVFVYFIIGLQIIIDCVFVLIQLSTDDFKGATIKARNLYRISLKAHTSIKSNSKIFYSRDSVVSVYLHSALLSTKILNHFINVSNCFSRGIILY